jgi:cystathionine gamma-synthase
VLAPHDAFYGTQALLKNILSRWGLQSSQVNMQELSAVERALEVKPKLVWLETPSNPLMGVTDLRAVVAMAKSTGALVACDNTVATPMLQRPLELGADIVMHSVTKFLSGHSDVLSGVLVFREAGPLFERVHEMQRETGGVPSPFECWLTLRGIQTFPYRMRAHCENAQHVAEFLSRHPRIEAVHYPGLATHKGHKVAASQMTGGFGGLMSMQVRGGREAAFNVCAGVKIFTHATSLGGTHSLIEHRASVEGPNTLSPQNLLRLSIGLEHWEDLIADLDQALS